MRPLDLAELAEAVAINPDDDSLFDNEDRLFDPERLVAVLSGLVLVTDGNVRLAHFSVQEYLLSDRLRDSTAAEFYVSITQINLNLAHATLRYLQSPCIQEEQRTKTPPLIDYAAHHWSRKFDVAKQSIKRIWHNRSSHFSDARVLARCGSRLAWLTDLTFGSTWGAILDLMEKYRSICRSS